MTKKEQAAKLIEQLKAEGKEIKEIAYIGSTMYSMARKEMKQKEQA